MNFTRVCSLLLFACLSSYASETRPSNFFYRVSAAGMPLKLQPVLYAPRPDYPGAAIKQRLDGNGVVEINIQPNGSVASTRILQSTGHRILDEAALRGFRRWRFRPHSVTVVRVPIQFRLDLASVRWGSRQDLKTIGDADMVVIVAHGS